MGTMRSPESYRPFALAILVLMAGILISFELYLVREPARVAAEEDRDRVLAIAAGRELYADNCGMCHGEQGEGVDAPPLNDSSLLGTTPDAAILSLIASGVPNTEMPAWGQAHGGPFTDEQTRQLVAFMRSWESTAPDRAAEAMKGDPEEGLALYSATCVVCHGAEGQGAPRGSALNDPARLGTLDDGWYEATIADGRPALGMPTWGTVLSPVQIRNLVALLRAWGRGEKVELPGPAELLHEAEHELEEGNLPTVHKLLDKAAERATGELKEAIEEAAAAAESGDTEALQEAFERAEELAAGEGMGGMDMGVASGEEPTSGAMGLASGEAMPSGEAGQGGMEETMPLAPGEAEARSALADLRAGDPAAAVPRLQVSLAAAAGELREAVEHALKDLKAGKAEEARGVLEKVLP